MNPGPASAYTDAELAQELRAASFGSVVIVARRPNRRPRRGKAAPGASLPATAGVRPPVACRSRPFFGADPPVRLSRAAVTGAALGVVDAEIAGDLRPQSRPPFDRAAGRHAGVF